MSLVTHEKNGLIYFSSPRIPVPHGFSTRGGGVSKSPYDSLDLGPGRGDDPEAVLENSRRFCAAVLSGSCWKFPNQPSSMWSRWSGC